MSLAVKSPKKMKSKSSWRHRIELLHTLGEGTYGKVKLAVDSKTGEKMAVKYMMKKKMSTEQDMQRVRREIKILASINHEHIVQIYEVFENKEKFVIVMEYIDGGELYEYVNARGVLSDKDSRRIFRQVVAAVHHLHQAGVVHRDLKLENILLDSKGNVKLADFGLSNWWQHNRFLHTFCGSPLYASPEIVNGRPYYGPEVDTWSLGVILYTLVYGTMPFDGTNFERLRSQITSGDYYEPTRPSDAASLIRRLLTVNPAKRASVADVCRHWWTNVDCARSLWHEVQEVKAESQADKRTSDYFEDDSLFVEPDQQLPGAAAAEAAADEAPSQQQHPERSADEERREAAVTWDAGSSSSRCLAPSTATDVGPAAERRAILLPGSETAAKCSSGDSGCALADQCVAAGDGSADGARPASAEEQESPTACLATAAADGCRYSMSDIDAVLDALDGGGTARHSAAAAAAAGAATHTASPAAAAAVVGQVSPPPAESRVSPGSRRRSISVLHGSVIVDRDAASLLDAKSGGDFGTAAARAEAQQQRARSASLNASKLVRCAVRDSDRKQRTDGGSVSSQSSCGNLLDFDNSDISSDDNL